MLFRPMMLGGVGDFVSDLKWNPADRTDTTMAVSGDGLTATSSTSAQKGIRATIGKMASGSVEFVLTGFSGGSTVQVGLSKAGIGMTANAVGRSYWRGDGLVIVDTTTQGTLGPSYASGALLRIRYDAAAQKQYFSVNGGAESVAYNLPASSSGVLLYPSFGASSGGVSAVINGAPVGATPWG